jgi:hypothetical protein
MDSIEERYNILKSITGIALVIAFILSFGSLLIRESVEIQNIYIHQLKKMKRFR